MRLSIITFNRIPRIALQPDDTMMLLHLPRAAGASLRTLLAPLFPADSIYAPAPGEAATPLPHHRLFCLYDTPFGPYSDLYAHVRHVPLLVTMLREPVSRTVSAYRAMRAAGRLPASMTLLDFIHDEAAQPILNGQTRVLAGAVRGNLPDDPPDRTLPDVVRLQLAQEAIGQAAFVGVVEEFLFSAAILSYTFGVKLPDTLPHENASPPAHDPLPDAAFNAIADANALDTALYDEAVRLLRSAFAGIRDQEVLERKHANGIMRDLREQIAVRDQQLKDPLRLWSGRVVRSARRRAKKQMRAWFPAADHDTSE